MTKQLQVYQVLVALADENGVCSATQAEIARQAGVSRPRIIPILRALMQAGMIEIDNSTRHYGARARKRYTLSQKLSHEKVTQSPELSHEKVTQSPELSHEKVTQSPEPSHEKVTQSPLMIHDMIHDHDKNTMKQITMLLNFITGKNLTTCVARCDLARAQAARALYEYCQNYDAWAEYGVRKNGVGWIVRLLKNGSPIPPPRQMPLPAAVLDFSPPAELDDLWGRVQAILRPQVTRATYDTIILPACLLPAEGGGYVIAAPPLALDWLEHRLAGLVQQALTAVIGGPVQVKFSELTERDRP
jgi:hypothetical protein